MEEEFLTRLINEDDDFEDTNWDDGADDDGKIADDDEDTDDDGKIADDDEDSPTPEEEEE